MKTVFLTPAAGKRLIGRATAAMLNECGALRDRTVVIVAGTTNGYVAHEALDLIGRGKEFSRSRFFRGITTPPAVARTDSGRLPDESAFPGDVVIEQGHYQPGKTIFDVVDTLQEGDIIVKGANSVNLESRRAGILIGHPRGGTILSAMTAVAGRRIDLWLPIGCEKRISGDLEHLAARINRPGATGPRLFCVGGKIVTEMEALGHLCGVRASCVAGGGVCGGEGGVWLLLEGEPHNVEKAVAVVEGVAGEEPFLL